MVLNIMPLLDPFLSRITFRNDLFSVVFSVMRVATH